WAAALSLFGVDGALQLGLVHPRTPFDAPLARLVAKLFVGPPSGAGVGPQSTTALRRDVLDGCPAPLFGFAGPSSVLVYRPSRDLFRFVLAGSALLEDKAEEIAAR